MRVKEESEKAGLKLNIQKTKIMASVPITSGQIEVETVEAVTDFIFLGSRITVDGGCSNEIKRSLLHGRKAMTNLDGVLEKAVATHSSTPAWRIPWTEEPVDCSPWSLEESDTAELLHFDALEKEMATHSSVLAWRIPGTGKPGGLLSMGSHRVGHD